MPWSPKRRTLVTACVLAGAMGVAASGRLPEWVRYVESGSTLEEIFFAERRLPGGEVPARRLPLETRPLLGERISAEPDRAELYLLRAREAERALDFEAAESDWMRYAQLVEDPAEGALALADFYERRLRPDEEADQLLAVGRAPDEEQVEPLPVEERRSWQAFERLLRTIDDHALDQDRKLDALAAWLTRFPGEPAVYERRLAALLDAEQFTAAEDLLAEYRAAFPDQTSGLLRLSARLAGARDGANAELTVYEQAFDPLWPQPLIIEYFNLLDREQLLRQRLDEQRAARSADRSALAPAAWIFHYRQRQGDREAALAELTQYLAELDQPTPEQFATAGKLFLSVNAANDAARAFHALYSLDGASDEQRETALSELVALLLDQPEQPIHLGAEDLSFYRDIATVDPHPGFFNGVLSLLFNQQGVDWQFRSQDYQSRAYYRRAKAVELLDRLDQEFPGAPRRAALHAKAVAALAVYGDNQAVIRRGEAFLTDFPGNPVRADVSLRMAEAFARTGQTSRELETYDRLLAELAEAAGGVPLGRATLTDQLGRSRAQGPRSPEYARVLDRYVARLAALQRSADAIRLYMRELSRNPDDPGLYEKLAGYLDANGLLDRVEGVYRQAIARFDDTSWHHRLARWYIRRQRAGDVQRLTREVTDAFAGSEVEAYFQRVVPGAGLDAGAYLAVNLYAHERFPHNLTFVRNLLNAYARRETANPSAAETLLRRHWFSADDLRRRYFGLLKQSGRLEQQLAAVQVDDWASVARDNPAAAQFWAEGQVWRRHYEEAAPAMLAMATEAPLDQPLASRTASVHRSLAHTDAIIGDIAAALADAAAKGDPGDRQTLALAGDTLADRALFEQARPYWERMRVTEPGRPEAWLDAATVFWDYYLFDDALATLEQGRESLNRPGLFAYEAGAIREGQGSPEGAVKEYLAGALAAERDYQAFGRLITLARRDGFRPMIDQATAALTAGAAPSFAAIDLRVRVLETQDRYGDLETFLSRLIDRADSSSLLDAIENTGAARRSQTVQAQLLERRVALTRDPVEAMRLRLALVRLQEARGEDQAAERVSSDLYAENDRILGVVRGRVDYLWREGRREQAVDTLLEASAKAYPELRDRLAFEAAAKSVEAQDFTRGREILDVLLSGEPLSAAYLTAKAESYARQGLDAELRDFYQETLDAVAESSLGAVPKRDLTAQLRRGLIPALDRLGEQAAAVDQYIELVNRFPEDQGLVLQAARYAQDNALAERMESAYERTTEQSPRDVRYHRVLAWVRAELEDLPGALDAYRNALDVRPDSTDLWQSRAELEERLLRFSAARQSYRKLWELTYEDPRWMEAIARNDVRLGEYEAAAESVATAWIEGRPERPGHYFRAARALEDLGLLDEAFQTARKGVVVSGDRLLDRYPNGAGDFLRLAVKLRRYETAYERVRDSWTGSVENLPTWSWQSGLREMSLAAREYFDDQERREFVAFLDGVKGRMSEQEFRNALLPAVSTEGPVEAEVAWLRESIESQPAGPHANNDRRRLIELERSRMRHRELGAFLETAWSAHPDSPRHTYILSEAADAYRDGGAIDEELRVRRTLGLAGDTERYYTLLLERAPEELLARCAADKDTGRFAAELIAVAADDGELVRRCVQAAGRFQPPVWTSASLGLVSLFHQLDDVEAVNGDFEQALGGGNVGERVGAAVSRDRQLAGDLWYPYGASYGRYLETFTPERADDYLPATLEERPGSATAYFDLAERALAADRLTAAQADYEHALELAPEHIQSTERLAEIAWREGRRAAAVAGWRLTLERLVAVRSMVYWEEAPALLAKLRERDLLETIGEPVTTLLEDRVRSNGVYRLRELAAAVGVDRVAPLADRAPDPSAFLSVLAELEGLSESRRLTLLDQGIAAAASALAGAPEQLQHMHQQQLLTLRIKKLDLLLAAGRVDAAAEIIAVDGFVDRLAMEKADTLLRFGAQADRLDEMFDELGYGVESARDDAVRTLRDQGREQLAQRLLERLYERGIERRELSAANFLGLAEMRLRQGRSEEAEALIARLLTVTPIPFSQHVAAADLLQRFGRDAKARELLAERLEAAPWDWEARVKLARASDDQSGLDALAENPQSPVEWRTLARGGEPEQLEIATLEARIAAQPDRSRGERLALFDKLVAEGEGNRAVESLREYLRMTSGFGRGFETSDSVFSEYFDEQPVDDWIVERFLATLGLSDDRRAAIAAALARAFEADGKRSVARAAAAVATRLAPDEGEYGDLLRTLTRRLQVGVENARRRPVLREDLLQPQPVLPKLTEASAP